MAELLVKAKSHWMDSFKQADINKLSLEQKDAYEARTTIGDIIVVKPNGWEWGNSEKLPGFIVIKVPDISYEIAKKLEESMYQIDGTDDNGLPRIKMRYRKKWSIPLNYMNTLISNGESVVVINLTEQQDFINNLVEKTE